MSNTEKKPVQLAILFSLIAWASGFYSLWHQLSLFTGTSEDAAFCNINNYINCDAVALSPYSTLLGLPLASLAMAFFASLVILFLLIYFAILDRNQKGSDNLISLTFWLSLLSLPVSLTYALISLLVIKSLCISCLVIYVMHISILACTFKLKKTSSSAFPSLRALTPSTAVAVLVVAGLNLLSPKFVETSLSGGNKIDNATASLYLARHLSNPQFSFSEANAAVTGSPDAKVVIVSFSDYQCPYCKIASNIIPTIARAYGSGVRLVYKDFPLNSACNPSMSGSGHPYACAAAKLAKCSLKNLGIDGYLKTSKQLYNSQATLGSDSISSIGKNVGLSDQQIESCSSSLEIHDEIVANTKEASAAKVESTPSIFINGRRLDAATNPQILRLTIEHYLKN